MNPYSRNLLPNCESAIIENSKLTEYALNPDSDTGTHKARVFQSALGFNLTNWQLLKQAILDMLPQHEAQFKSETIFGKKYTVELSITGPNGNTVPVLTAWQFDRRPDGTLSEVPRLVTLYITD
ncbi:MAG: hypothetical protein H8D67_27055 [Deltaproteobacteria bacterium]|nr:hypothetical protein [Deltaproteobacteria bacterium]